MVTVMDCYRRLMGVVQLDKEYLELAREIWSCSVHRNIVKLHIRLKLLNRRTRL